MPDLIVRGRVAIRSASGFVRSVGRQKVFCIGRNKTGTTSLKKAMSGLGYVVGCQRTAELFLRDWAGRDFNSIAAYCRTGTFFQDIPFSLSYTFQAMDMLFPGSKFILTVRDSPEQWYQSLTGSHKKAFGADRVASLTAPKEVEYCYKGFAYDARVLVHDCIEADPYNRQILIDHYNFHNQMVKDYFRNRPI